MPINDPTLLFTNAGMNQFKPIFVGRAAPGSSLASLDRAANSQKCIRAGGKHNDLEDVGKDVYHHTFFEMLGNWSFGDYFKEEAIDMAWELLTDVYGIEPDRLYATYFEGSEEAGLEPDTEARDLWKKYLPESRILPGNMKDNFWEMGDTGPCGPCSELHYDRIGGRDAAHLVNADVPEVLEIWNLVFMQYERTTDGLVPLPAKHVDTGAGLERIVSVLQNKMSNYDTDLFTPIFEAIQAITGARDYTGLVGDEDLDKIDMAYRVVADHIRTLTFAIADGGLPSNTGRGYVVRRVLRRAIRYIKEKLGGAMDSLHQLVDVVVENFGDAFPSIVENRDLVVEIISVEEVKFGRTLDRGVQLFHKVADAAENGMLAGKTVFQLYDTFGFPVDLTELMADERGLTIDWDAFEKERAEAVERSKSAKTASGITLDTVHIDGFTTAGSTDDSAKFDDDAESVATEIVKVFAYDAREFVPAAGEPGVYGVMTTATNFYAEGGGQIYDQGTLVVGPSAEDGTPVLSIFNTQEYAGSVVHYGKVVDGADASVIAEGASVWLVRDSARRGPVKANHTSTHLLNHALRSVLGEHVKQRGSLVDDEKLRFDFSHNSKVGPTEVAQIEAHVNKVIADALPVFSQVVPFDDATGINGLQQVFGESYPENVRVVSVGAPIADMLADPTSDSWPAFAIELCGGTHLSNSSEAEAFVVLVEESIGGGTRRMTGVTGDAAREAIGLGSYWEGRIADLEAASDAELAGAFGEVKQGVDQAKISVSTKDALQARVQDLFSRLSTYQKAQAQEVVDAAIANVATLAENLGDGPARLVHIIPMGDIKKVMQKVTKAYGNNLPGDHLFCIINSSSSGKLQYSVTASKASGVSASDILAAMNEAVGGRGGGRPTYAAGAVPVPEDGNVDALVETLKTTAEGLIL